MVVDQFAEERRQRALSLFFIEHAPTEWINRRFAPLNGRRGKEKIDSRRRVVSNLARD